MNKQDFYFELPPELIAQYPLAKRRDSRLLNYNRHTQTQAHYQFSQLSELLEPGDLLVMNDTKVIPARFFGLKETGGRVEFLVERVQDDHHFLAHIKASKAPRAGMTIFLDAKWQVKVMAKIDDLYQCFVSGDIETMLEEIGHIPLPPYITRTDETLDKERYQTIYAKHKGSVAAPTAGLHFDDYVLAQLQEKGIQLGYCTLHVGAGTFRPVRCENINDHKMHKEHYVITEELSELVKQTQSHGGRIIAVGTTAMRSLESATQDGYLKPGKHETDIFIYPGYTFKLCNGLITNFHLPESTLLMLVSAFIGYQQTMALYKEAIAKRYRFFSYGDACLLL
ncbi:S-adenosylmethionine--tRNA ribosyltransferase-isomerase [Legionella beliardensis]|uniref:S-adenosylmethionine:tRNA ribosyltransferase-isomerase n=1 Tax=Legionella beliardensis TaxID=91822 RepID=A0A378I2Y9_9GAMM|nr:tRNA preQ1(34) S-adenosylmethionine ribosyltransferase-isomerase QueA [Legionella beliardensis]STX29353.1 S-adenosylmethionine--tRNA ribosyltransferase-isomerase [Legionella beliardensis]